MKKKLKILLAISFFIIIIISSKSFATTGTITQITVNVRQKASTNSNIIARVTQDDEVEIIETNGDWCKIKINNKTGYVYSKYVKEKEQTDNKENEDTKKAEEINQEEQETTTNVDKNLLLKSKSKLKLVPSILSDSIYTAKSDVKINIIEQINEWTYVSVENINGWARTDELIETNTKEPEDAKKENNENEETKKLYIKYDSVNIRKEPSTDSKILEKLKLNDEVTFIENVDSIWCKIKVGDKIGYVSQELLTQTKQEETKQVNTTSRDGAEVTREQEQETKEVKEKSNTTNNVVKTNIAATTKTKGEEIVEYAKKYLGYKYVYGGTSPSGFDCSGFTSYVYKHFGYKISRSSLAQANDGIKVEKSDLKLGDILIFKNNSLTKIGHVGLYIGGNKMIHASEPGIGVTITDIDSKAYKYPQRYVMARRIIK